MLQTLLTICACKTTCDTPLAGSRCTRGHVNPLQLAAPSCALLAGPCSNDELLQRLLVFDDFQPAPVLRPRSNTSTGISLYELLRPSSQESVAPDSQEIGRFIHTAAAAFHGRRCKRWHRGCTRLSYVLQIIRAVHRSDDRDSGALALGGLFAQETRKNLVCRIDQYSCLSAVSEKKIGGRRCGAESAMKYDQAPYMHCTNLGWLV